MKKPFYKRIWFWIVVAIFVAAGIDNIFHPVEDQSAKTEETSKKASVKSSSKKSASLKKDNKHKEELASKKATKASSKSSYKASKKASSKKSSQIADRKKSVNKLKLGMSKEEVVKLIGKPLYETKEDNSFDYKEGTIFFDGQNKVNGGTTDGLREQFTAATSSKKAAERSSTDDKQDEQNNKESIARYFGNKSEEYLQKRPYAYAKQQVNGEWHYMYKQDNITYLRVDSSDNNTTVYEYNSATDEVGQTLYQGQTIFYEPAKRTFNYQTGQWQ